MRELLFVADGSAQQLRLGRLLLEGAPRGLADVAFTVYGDVVPERKPETLVGESGEAVGVWPDLGSGAAVAAAADAPAPGARAGSVVLGSATLNLRDIFESRFQPVGEPLELKDKDGRACGVLRASLLARDAVQRAWTVAAKAQPKAQLALSAVDLALDTIPRAASLRLEMAVYASGVCLATAASAPLDVPSAASARGGALPLIPIGLEREIALDGKDFDLEKKAALHRALLKSEEAPGGGAGRGGGLELRLSLLSDVTATSAAAFGRGKLSLQRLLDGGKESLSAEVALKAPGPDGHLTKSVVGRVQVSVGGRAALAALHHESSIVVKEEAALRARTVKAAVANDGAALRQAVNEGGHELLGSNDAWRQTALHWAAAAPGPPPGKGQENAVSACLKMGAIPDARNVARMTPLHWASAWGNAPAAKALLAAGADRRAKDVCGREAAAVVHRHVTGEDVDSKAKMLEILKLSR